MLGTILVNLDTTIRMINHFLLHPFHFISHYDSVLLRLVQFESIQHNAAFRLFYRINNISFFTEVINSINSVINILPVNSELCAQSRLMHFGVGRSSRYSTQIDTLDTESIRGTKHGTYIMQATNIIQHYYQRQFFCLFKLFGTDTVQLCYFQFSHTFFLLLHFGCKGSSFLLTEVLITV